MTYAPICVWAVVLDNGEGYSIHYSRWGAEVSLEVSHKMGHPSHIVELVEDGCTPGELEAARKALANARSILSEAVGHEDTPEESLENCARLLVLDCNAEHERAVQAEEELQQCREDLMAISNILKRYL